MKWKEFSRGRKSRRKAVERRRTSRQQRPRRLFKTLLTFMVWGALGVAGWVTYPVLKDLLCQNPYFKITRITFSGLQNVTEREMRAILPPLGGINLFALDFTALRARLVAHPWVEEAELHRKLPDQLRIEIRERHPVALASREGLWALDVHGLTLPLESRPQSFDLPLINLGPGQRFTPGFTLAETRILELLPRLEALRHRLPELWSSISEITWDEKGQLELIALTYPTRIVLGEHPTWQQMRNLYSFLLYQGQRQGVEDVIYMDLRFEGRLVIKREIAVADSTSSTLTTS